MTDDPRLGPIMQILVPVTDVDRAAAFYADVLGLPLLFRYPGNAFFDAHGVRLYLAALTEPGYTGPATIYFRVAEYDLWLAFVTDPDGNNIGLMREAPKGLAAG